MHRLWIVLLCAGISAPAAATTLSSSDFHLVEKVSKEVIAAGDAINASAHATIENGAEQLRTLSPSRIRGVTSDTQCLMRLNDIVGSLSGYFYALLISSGEAQTMLNQADSAHANAVAKLAFEQAVRVLAAERKPIQDIPPMFGDSTICQIKSDDLLRTLDDVTTQLNPLWKKLGGPTLQ